MSPHGLRTPRELRMGRRQGRGDPRMHQRQQERLQRAALAAAMWPWVLLGAIVAVVLLNA